MADAISRAEALRPALPVLADACEAMRARWLREMLKAELDDDTTRRNRAALLQALAHIETILVGYMTNGALDEELMRLATSGNQVKND